MSRERLELVKDFGELKAGMKVILKTCGWCGKDHEFFLIRSEVGELLGSDGSWEKRAHWLVLPELHEDDSSGPMAIADYAVGERRVYRVLDGLEKEQTTETRKTVRA